MVKKEVSKKTQTKVRKYLDYILETENDNRIQDENILSILSENLKNEILREINGKVLRENALFHHNFGTKFLAVLYNHLEEITFTPSEVIFDVNQTLSFLIF